MRGLSFIRAQGGSAASEFALTLPMMLVLLFGGMEAGHFVWTQHKLAEAVRDGARYAGRIPMNSVCEGTDEVLSQQTRDDIILLTRTGQVVNPDAPPKVPGWTADEVTVEPNCANTAFMDTGLYSEYAATYPGAKGPVLVVSADDVAYPWMFRLLGSMMSGITGNGTNPLDIGLQASSISPGIGL
jgi:hypothetical protein